MEFTKENFKNTCIYSNSVEESVKIIKFYVDLGFSNKKTYKGTNFQIHYGVFKDTDYIDFWENDNGSKVLSISIIDDYYNSKKNMFEKDQYIVCLKQCYNQFDINYIYKQRETNKCIKPYLDNEGHINNIWLVINFEEKDSWRYPTTEEIAMYDKAGKPVDVTIKSVKERIDKDFKFKIGDRVVYNKAVGTVNSYWQDKADETVGVLFDEENKTFFAKPCQYPLQINEYGESIKFTGNTYNYYNCKTNQLSFYTKQPEVENNISMYQCLPFPDNNFIKLRVVKDIIKSDIKCPGTLPDIIPAGSITWEFLPRSKFCLPERNRHSANIPIEYFEIIEEVEKLPLSMEEIQAECKKRFPIGCKVKNTSGDIFILEEDDYVYRINVGSIWASRDKGCLYSSGTYAKLISLPEKKVELDQPTTSASSFWNVEPQVGYWIKCIKNFGSWIAGNYYQIKKTDKIEGKISIDNGFVLYGSDYYNTVFDPKSICKEVPNNTSERHTSPTADSCGITRDQNEFTIQEYILTPKESYKPLELVNFDDSEDTFTPVTITKNTPLELINLVD